MNNAEVLHFQDYAGSRVNPQVENGHTRIANELLEAILSHGFTHRQQTIVLAIIRKTYGYNKKVDDMSLEQLVELTGMKKQHVSTTLVELEKANVITREKGRHAYRIGLNKIYTSWLKKGETKTGIVTESVIKGSPKRLQNVTETVTTKDNTKRQPKEKIKDSCPTALDATLHDAHVSAYQSHIKAQGKDLQDRAWNAFWTEYPRKDKKKPARKLWDKLPINRDHYITIVRALKAQKKAGMFDDRQFSPMPTTWLGEERWNDEISGGSSQAKRKVVL